MTESFGKAMAFAQKISDCEFGAHPNESVREWCEMSDYDGTCVVCLNRLLDRLQRAHESDIAILQNEHERRIIELQRAHEREMETVRDPQRIGGTLERDSFEYALEQLREFRWQHATNDDDAIPYINGVAKAHDHEMEHLRKERFREGYEAGRRSMDAEHYAVALRLRQLPLDEDGHGNLSQIARAVWHSDFGWTQGACAALRDELVRLMGGVSDGTCPNANRTCPNAVQGASITDDGSDHEPSQSSESGDPDCDRSDCRRGESQEVICENPYRSGLAVIDYDGVIRPVSRFQSHRTDNETAITDERDRTIAKFKRAIEKYKTMYEERRDAYNRCAEDYNNMLHDHVNLKHKLDAIRDVLDE